MTSACCHQQTAPRPTNAPSLGRETGLQEHGRGSTHHGRRAPGDVTLTDFLCTRAGDDARRRRQVKPRSYTTCTWQNVTVERGQVNGVAVGSLGAVRRPRQLGGQRFVRGRVQHAHLGRRVCQNFTGYLAAANSSNKSSNRTTTSVSCSARQPCENITFVDLALAAGAGGRV